MAMVSALGTAACPGATASPCASSSSSEQIFARISNARFTKSRPSRVRLLMGHNRSSSRSDTKRSPSASMRDAEQLVQSGVVRNVAPEEVSALLSQGSYKILDVRPVWEREKAYVAGSYHIPLFVEDLSTGPLTLVRKAVQMGQGGWWIGLKLTVKNDEFLEQVENTVPKGEKLLVVCGEGLRSLLAIEELTDGGYEQLAWLRGGFNNVRDDAVQNVEGSTRLRFATLGGASEILLNIALFFQKLTSSGQKSEI
ncbi:hypothetical protein R1sor_003091 [Riccia sorocarpa]|uniref:Rhodanese domain-containing protein n=1 Tax=Riccia sorocarpa TaxID=122646 RepID=A0ABD3H6Q7_9MARC